MTNRRGNIYIISAATKTHLRLQAGISFLKLISVNIYESIFDASDYTKIALVVQDPIYNVRYLFCEKLCLFLQSRKLHLKYLMWLMLSAHEPDEQLRKKVFGFNLRLKISLLKNPSNKDLKMFQISRFSLNNFSFILHILWLIILISHLTHKI